MAVMASGEKERLRPDVRAALLVALPVILLEMLTDLLPVIGLLIAIPISITVYFLQGVLVARYSRGDARYPNVSQAEIIGLAARSALWTGALVSPLAAAVTLLLGVPISVGVLIAWVPGILAATLVDLLLNLAFAALGAWASQRANGQNMFAGSCLWVVLGAGVAWLGVALLTAVAIIYIIGH